MPKKIAKRKTSKTVRRAAAAVPKHGIVQNQFFGLLLVAIGVGALVVIIRYFIISTQVPTSVYLIQPSDLIPGAVTK